ncbi:unnamed protein product [Lampetra planeri]
MGSVEDEMAPELAVRSAVSGSDGKAVTRETHKRVVWMQRRNRRVGNADDSLGLHLAEKPPRGNIHSISGHSD